VSTSQRRENATGRVDRFRKALYWSLLSVTAFNAISALAGGVAILLPGVLGMPRSMLVNGPFDSFLLPGLVLALVVGGTQSLAAGLLFLGRESAPLWTSVAGFGMVIWIFVETGVIATISWLQVVYFASGSLQLILVLALLGIAGWLPRAPLSVVRTHFRRGAL